MPAEMTSKILAFVKSEIREYNSMFTVCNHIMEKLNNEYGERWHCNAFFNQMGSSAFSFEHQRMIKLKFGKLEIEIYKTQYVSISLLSISQFVINSPHKNITCLLNCMQYFSLHKKYARSI